MQWKPKKLDRGQFKSKKKFAWIPTKCSDEYWVWLERYEQYYTADSTWNDPTVRWFKGRKDRIIKKEGILEDADT